MKDGYKLMTNFDNTDNTALRLYIAIKAVGITDFLFCKTARDVFGEILPNHASLWFKKTVSEKDRELFWQAFHFTAKMNTQ